MDRALLYNQWIFVGTRGCRGRTGESNSVLSLIFPFIEAESGGVPSVKPFVVRALGNAGVGDEGV